MQDHVVEVLSAAHLLMTKLSRLKFLLKTNSECLQNAATGMFQEMGYTSVWNVTSWCKFLTISAPLLPVHVHSDYVDYRILENC